MPPFEGHMNKFDPKLDQILRQMVSASNGSIVITTTGYANAIKSPGSWLRTTIYTTGATWTKGSDVGSVKVRVQAGGGGGGAVAGVASKSSSGGGGGAGGYCEKDIAAGSLGATETVTVGIGGTAGAGDGSPNDGGTGGTSSFGSHASASGGVGGGGSSGTNTNTIGGNGGAGGVGSSTDFNIVGGPGSYGVRFGVEVTGFGGNGGTSPFGGGAAGGSNTPGTSASNYGGGGSGASSYTSSNKAGGAGNGGYVIVEEYS